MTNTEKIRKKQNLGNNKYFNLQNKFDNLYKKSKNQYKFSNLMDLITNEDNIRLAFRTIKTNNGSKTCGTDNKNINNIKIENLNNYIKHIKKRLKNYKP